MAPPIFKLCVASCATAICGAAAAQDAPRTAPPQAADSYYVSAAAQLDATLARQANTNPARNVILFIGDGMGVSTITASRIFTGQRAGVDGESFQLTMETLPYAALARTFTSDAQVADSAPTATAMMSGVKTRNDTIGLDQTVEVGVCGSGVPVKTIAEMAEDAGFATGIVSTARITHATPAGMYAHTPSRDWEADSDVEPATALADCPDIAHQLVTWGFGDGFEVILGGGRSMFLPETTADPEYPDKTGDRADGRDLVAEWLNRHDNQAASYVWNLEGFDAVDPAATDKLFGLFEPSHMQYNADRTDEPTLAQMTTKAIDMLAKDPEGYVLMVEAGRIDHAHHDGNAFRALDDTAAFDEAIKAALDKVDLSDTLVVVTADHSHVFTLSGYPERGNPILGLVREVGGEIALADDGKPYTTLGYQNGPGSVFHEHEEEEAAAATPAAAPTNSAALPAATIEGAALAAPATDAATTPAAEAPAALERPDLTGVDTTARDFKQQSLVPLSSETHGGEDVTIYADGPFAHLFQGTVDQQYIFHVMQHALGWDAR